MASTEEDRVFIGSEDDVHDDDCLSPVDIELLLEKTSPVNVYFSTHASMQSVCNNDCSSGDSINVKLQFSQTYFKVTQY